MIDSSLISDAYVEFQAAVLKALPRDMSDNLCLYWVGSDEFLTEKLATVFFPQYPANDEVFPLTIARPFTGLEMARNDGFAGKWRFTGEEILQPQTKRFKLVSIGDQPNFAGVQRELAKRGIIPQGQWRKAFKMVYPKSDDKGSIGVADSSWVDPNGRVFFPYVYTNGNESFCSTDYVCGSSWRWLIEYKQ